MNFIDCCHKNVFMQKLCVIIWFLTFAPELHAQTCCSGGVPLSSGLGMPQSAKGTWQISLNYDINVLKTLKEDGDNLNDNTRQRITQSLLLQTSHSFSNRLSVDLLFSYVKQNRRIDQFGNTDVVNTHGLGDAALLVKYQLTNLNAPNFILVLASGPKIPTGRSDMVREDGIPLNADLQPGSGAWDGIFWGYGAYKFNFRPSMNLSLTTVFSLKGKNENYLGNETYQFGNEIQLILSINDNYMIGNKILDASLIFRYRNALQDRFNDITMPNTGGKWIFLSPRFSLNISKNISLNFTAELPLLGIVEGTQLSPTYRLNAGVFIKIPNQKQFIK